MRKKIHEPIEFQVYPYQENVPKIVWKDLIATKGLLPDDVVEDISRKRHVSEPGSWGYEEGTELYTIVVTVKRWRDETDEEYFQRKVDEERSKKQFDEQERLNYLRLKAKFEDG